LGLKHAMEADHLAAVSTIVSERKGLLSASVVGGLWGVGHTISLLVAGLAVILFQVKIGPRMEMVLEFGVALMLIALGANAIRKLRHGGQIHLHAHRHSNRIHIHPHLHEDPLELNHSTHHGLRSGTRPLLVGMVHGLAGSAVLMLLVLSTIKSPMAGVVYIVIFGLGSIGGMMAMSILIGLPLRVTARRFAEANLMLRGAAAFASLGIGLIMIYQNGVVQDLVR
jgi:sulfite exporter TauE/SafE